MPSICAVIGCSNKGGRDRVSFFNLPIVRNHSGDIIQELSLLRHEMWLRNIGRKFMENTTHWGICSNHFIRGKPAPLHCKTDPDWAPTLNMGHNNINKADMSDMSEELDWATDQKVVENIHTNKMNQQPDDTEVNPSRQEEQTSDGLVNRDMKTDLASLACARRANLSVLQMVENIHTNKINQQHADTESDPPMQLDRKSEGLDNGNSSTAKMLDPGDVKREALVTAIKVETVHIPDVGPDEWTHQNQQMITDDVTEKMSCDSPGNSPQQKQEKIYTDSGQSSRVMRRLSELWREEKLCDAEISNGTTTIKAHKVVLIATCPALLSLNKDIWSQTDLMVQIPPHIERDTIHAFLVYIYDGVLWLTADNLPQMRLLATSMNVDSLLDHCEQFQMDIITLQHIPVELKDNGHCQTRASSVGVQEQLFTQPINSTKPRQIVQSIPPCSSEAGLDCSKQPSSHLDQSTSHSQNCAFQHHTRPGRSSGAVHNQSKSSPQPILKLVAVNRADSPPMYSLLPIKPANPQSSCHHVLSSDEPSLPCVSTVNNLPVQEDSQPSEDLTSTVQTPMQNLTAISTATTQTLMAVQTPIATTQPPMASSTRFLTQTLSTPTQTLIAPTKTLITSTQILTAPTQTEISPIYQVASSLHPVAPTSNLHVPGNRVYPSLCDMYNRNQTCQIPEARQPVPAQDPENISDPSLYFKRRHRLKRQYKCEKCSELLFTEAHAVQHMESAHQVHVEAKDVMEYVAVECQSSVIACGICEYQSNENRDQVQYHRYFQHQIPLPKDLKIHRCETCSKEFCRMGLLTEYMNTHKDHASNVCEMHVCRCHNDEMRFVCRKCGKNCKTRSGIRIHLRSHIGVRPFKCPQCSYQGTNDQNQK